MLVMGHLDDRRGLSAWSRLLVQTGCAALLVFVGIRVTVFLPDPWLHGVLTVLFVVFLTNAVNFIDNMNGLLAGVVAAAVLHLLCLAVASGQLFMAALLIALAGGLLGFLARNFPVARVFIGDAGSMALGFLLAAFTVLFTFTEEARPEAPILMPLLILAVPLLDGLTVVAGRLRRGVHPFTAGHDHLSHRLVARGWSQGRAVVALWGAGAACGVPVLLLARVPAEVILAVWGPALLLVPVCMRWNLRQRR
jgi:UDP-GlcNAc:undecaprenyl-phosphate GlcNAc-1-phosphate transferase